MKNKKCLQAAIAAAESLIALSLHLSLSFAGPPSEEPQLWAGESRGLFPVASDSGTLGSEIPLPKAVTGIALNDVNGDV